MKTKFSVIFILFSFMIIIMYYAIPKSAFAKEVSNFDNITSKSVYLADADSNTVIISKNQNTHYPIASMCKIMTLLLCFDEIDQNTISLDDVICVSQKASNMGGSQIFLEANGNYYVRDLIKGIVVASANDACVAMAEYICGSEGEFVDRMNKKADELNMKDTVFTNCTGLPKPGQYSCAKDVYTMFNELLNHKGYLTFSNIWMDKINHPKDRITEISNTNKLIRFYDGCDSGKTGYTSEAGFCICASAVRNDTRLISVVISAPDSKTRFKEASNMFNYGFNNYTNKIIVSKNTPLDDEVEVRYGKVDTFKAIPANNISIFMKKNENKSFNIDVNINKNLVAPIFKGDVVGNITVFIGGVEYKTVDLISYQDVLKASYFDVIIDTVDDWNLVS